MGFRFEVGFLIDNLTAMMMAVVTFVSLMVHIYTVGYMAHEEGYQRFFSYIALFTFSLLMLVMANKLHAAVLRLGSGRPGLLLADRLLFQERVGDFRQPQGVPRQQGRGFRLYPGDCRRRHVFQLHGLC